MPSAFDEAPPCSMVYVAYGCPRQFATYLPLVFDEVRQLCRLEDRRRDTVCDERVRTARARHQMLRLLGDGRGDLR